MLDDSTPPAWKRATQGKRGAKAKAEAAVKRESNGAARGKGRVVPHPSSAPQPVGKRARALVREQLANGPKPGDQIEAAAKAADIPERVLIAAASALGVRTQRGRWWIPGA